MVVKYETDIHFNTRFILKTYFTDFNLDVGFVTQNKRKTVKLNKCAKTRN